MISGAFALSYSKTLRHLSALAGFQRGKDFFFKICLHVAVVKYPCGVTSQTPSKSYFK